MGKRVIWQFLGGTLVLAMFGIVTVLVCLRSFIGEGDSAKVRCQNMVATLQRLSDPDAFRAEVKVLVEKYPSGAAHRLSGDEQSVQVRRIMDALGLGQAVICDDVMFGQRILAMTAPGGFASYGVKVLPANMPLAHITNANGLTELKWKDGIYVFYC